MTILSLDHISISYGKIQVVHSVCVSVDKGSIITLIGSNGAGKSTILKAVVGMAHLASGEILFKETRIDGLPIHDIVKMGISLCPEGRRVFPKMTVLENLKMGALLRSREEARQQCKWIYQYFPILEQRRNQIAGSLSGGEQQMLAIGRALMPNPELLLLDEPSLGLAPRVVLEIIDLIRLINQDRKVTIVLVEQNSRIALRLAKKGYVVETGSVVLEGEGKELLKDEYVRKAYLGG